MMNAVEPTEVVFKIGIARSQQHDLHIKFHQIFHFIDDKLKTLLIGQAADDPDQWNVWTLWQTKLFLQGRLILGLAF